MTETSNSLKDDIAYMAGLARDGHKPTYAGGEFLLVIGLLFGLTSFAVAASLAGYLPIEMSWIWLASMIAFFIFLPILIIRSRRSGSYRMIGNRTVGEAWSAIGFAIFTIAVCIGVISWRLNEPDIIWLFSSIILALYGVGWSVSAAMSDRPWTRALAIGSFISAVIVAYLVKWPALMFAAYGVALLLLAALPGAVWIRLHRQAQG